MNKGEKWTEEEKELLKISYCISTKEKLMELFPNRSWDAIRTYACKELGLNRKRKTWVRDDGKRRECKACGKIFPQTEEYFYKDKKGFRTYCKKCWLEKEEEIGRAHA